MTVDESAGTMTFTVTRTGTSEVAIALDYATANGSATAGSDYTATTGTVTFAAGTGGTQTFTVPILEDSIVEGSESFTVALTAQDPSQVSAASDLSATGTITDNDTNTFAIGDVTVDESAGTMTFTVTRTGTSEVAIALDYATANGSATAGSDYTATTGTVTFAAGTGGTQTFTVPILEDSIVEGSENFTVALTAQDPSQVDLGASDLSAIGTIIDNDTATWSITGETSVTESADNNTASYTVSLGGTLQAGEDASIVLSLTNNTTNADGSDLATEAQFDAAVAAAVTAYNNGSAPGSLSYVAATNTLTFLSDGTGAMGNLVIDLTAVNDTLVEGEESYTVALATPTSTTGSAIALGADSTVTTIIDNDTATWSITGETSVTESADNNTASYTVSLGGTLQAGEDASIVLSLTNNTTNADGSDLATEAQFDAAVAAAVTAYNNGSAPGSLSYVAATNTLTFLSDGTGAMGNLVIDLTAVNDTLVEGEESYTVALATPTSTTGSAIALGADSTVTTIIDNDTATWSITGETSVTESADNNTASYTVSLGGTLQAGEDASIVLSLTNNTTNADGSDLATEAQFDAAVAAAVTAYNNGSAPGSLSYVAATNTLTFLSDGTGAMGNLVIDLTAVNDTLVEGEESYTVALATPTSTTGSAIALGADSTVTTIIDNDTATWSITGETSVTESADNNTASYTVSLGGTLQAGEDASIVLSLTNNTTNADGSDLATEAQFDAAVAAAVTAYNNGSAPGSLSYVAATNTLTFLSDGTGAMGNLVIDLTAVNDTLVEGEESYTVALATPTSTTGSAIALGADSTVTTIIDNDTATWSITGETSVTESADNNTASYTVSLGGTLQAGEDASIVLSLTNNTTNADGSDLATEAQFDAAVAAAVTAYNNGSAPGSLSYVAATNTLTFLSDGTGAMGNLVIDLTAVNDTLVEGEESYTVALATPTSTTGSAIALGADSTVTTIIDNDTATWSITGETSVTESADNNTASYTVSLGGTLQAGEDASIVLSLTNNTTNADGSDLATEAQFDAAVAAAVTAYNNGSAPGSLSYVAATNTLTFLSDGTGAMGNLVIDLTAVNDTLVEGEESYTVALATPTSTTGSAIALGADSTVTTIIDNDTATWSITGETSVTELADNNTASYTVSLGGTLQAGEDASIVLSLTNNTTNADGSDLATEAQFDAAVAAAVTAYNNGSAPGSLSYVAATNTLTFLSDGTGAMGNLVIDLTAVNDTLVEGEESYTVALATPTSTTGSAIALGADSTVTTIIDNDTATWSITGETSVTELADNNTASYTVSLGGTLQAGEDASIVLSLTNNTTNADGSDLATEAQFDAAVAAAVTAYNNGSAPGSLSYVAATNTLTFLSDGTGAMGNLVIDLTAVNDTLVEGEESYTVALATPTSTTGSAIALGANSTVTTIIDNDTATWSITGETSVTESADNNTASYTVSLGGTLQAGEDASIVLSLTNNTTNADGSDLATEAQFDAAVAAAVTAYNNGSAPGSLSYVAATNTLTFLSDGTGAMGNLVIDLTAVNDTLVEGEESYTVALATPTSTTGSAIALGADSTVTTIIDNDTATWSITGETSVTESADNNTASYTVSLGGTLQAGEDASIVLSLTNNTTNADGSDLATEAQFDAAVAAAVTAYNNGSAPGSLSYVAATNTLTFLSDGTGAMGNLVIDLTAVNDTLVEGEESYTVALATPTSTTGSAIALGADSTVTTIIDNDTATWSITGETSVTESADNNTASYTVSLGGTLQAGEDASIVLSLTNNTTNADGSDLATEAQFDAAVAAAVTAYNNGSAPGSLSYVAATNTLTFLSDGTGAMGNLVIDLTAVNDTLVEGEESYTVALATPTSTTGSAIALGADSTVTTIIDNDTATWSITGETSVTESADNNTASYTVSLGGTLQAGEDASIVLSLTNNTTNADGSDLATEAQFDAAVAAAVTAYNNGSAPGSLSYVAATNTLTFLSDGTGAMGNLVIDLTAVNDTLVEGEESYTVALATPTSTTGSAIALGADSTVTTIIDNDQPLADPNDFDDQATGAGLVGNIFRGSSNDDDISAINQAQIIYGGVGDDEILAAIVGRERLSGGSGNDIIFGNNGKDIIYGGSGNDKIGGGAGVDEIIGGFGVDELTGGEGNDRFVYLSVVDSRGGQFDTILDFTSGDQIDLTAAGTFTTFQTDPLTNATSSVAAHTIAWFYDGNQTIVYANPTDGALNGGSSSLVEIHLTGVSSVQAGDFLIQTAPAGVAGEPINLGLTAPFADEGALVTVTVVGLHLAGPSTAARFSTMAPGWCRRPTRGR